MFNFIKRWFRNRKPVRIERDGKVIAYPKTFRDAIMQAQPGDTVLCRGSELNRVYRSGVDERIWWRKTP